MANYEATRYDFDGQYLQDVEGVNTGIIVPWSTASVPAGFLECDGAAVSRTTYAALFAVVGTTYGVGDGSTTFNVPDLTDRTVVNKSPTKTFATTGGANTATAGGNVSVSLDPTTLSVTQIAPHTHYGAGTDFRVNNPDNDSYGSPPGTPFSMNHSGGGGAHGHTASGASFSGSTYSTEQPYLTVMYIIKT